MKLLFSILFLAFLGSCKSPSDLAISYEDSVEILSNSTNTVNELAATTWDKGVNLKLNSIFQSLSENKELSSILPKERVRKKTELLEKCSVSIDSCTYIPEGYSIATNRNFLNIKYQYNAFSSYDLNYKYAVVNLLISKRLTNSEMFVSPEIILEKYNAKYTEEYQNYLLNFDPTNVYDGEMDEYQIIKDHLSTKVPFSLEDLDNFELIFDAELDQFTEIRFHYNGASGNYKSVLTAGFISFKLSEIEDLLVEEFKNSLNTTD